MADGMKRRDFFKATGGILAALGISESDWLRLGDRYYQAIASPINRKLALLVGINQYPGNSSLNGCLTDVELQKELLIHRFGFKSSDIFTLTNAQATRRQIEDAFTNHLIEQAQPGDVVVFHFSGCGRRLQLSQKLGNKETTLNSLVTADSGTDNDLPENTLALMLRSLPTSAVTTVLDTSFHFPDVLPNYLRVRSLPQLEQWQLISEELAFQQQLIEQQQLKGNLTALQMPGTVLRAANTDKVAVEAQWTGLVAGLFTYALTQYLWEFTSPNSIQINLGRVGGVVEQTASKQKFSNKSIDPRSLLLMPSTIAGADGVVRAIEDDGKIAQLWLAGLPAPVLEYYGVNSRLTVVEPKKQLADNLEPNSVQVQVRSRTGLTAKAQIVNNSSDSLQVGQLLQEAIRVLPRNISLNVALDRSLERIERVDATSAFAAMPRVSLVTASDVPVDYVFGRVIEPKEATTPASRYGLFFDDRKPIPLAAGEAGEAVKVAVQRLMPKLRSLLAAKLWRLTNNSASSGLGVQATLEIVSPEQIIVTQQYSARSQVSPTAGKSLQNISLQLPAIPVGSRIQYRLQNSSDRPVYFLLVGLDSTKSAIALYPLQTAPESNPQEAKPLLQNLVIPPGEAIIVPQTAVDFQWLVHPPLAIAETHLIFSTASFTQTLAALQNGMPSGGEQGYISALANPLEVAQAVFQDLHNASAVKSESNTTADTYNLNVNTWASFNFIYQIV